jgi:hypothetical protein
VVTGKHSAAEVCNGLLSKFRDSTRLHLQEGEEGVEEGGEEGEEGVEEGGEEGEEGDEGEEGEEGYEEGRICKEVQKELLFVRFFLDIPALIHNDDYSEADDKK